MLSSDIRPARAGMFELRSIGFDLGFAHGHTGRNATRDDEDYTAGWLAGSIARDGTLPSPHRTPAGRPAA
jgi:hypothetical protein